MVATSNCHNNKTCKPMLIFFFFGGGGGGGYFKENCVLSTVM